MTNRSKRTDVLFVIPGTGAAIYQGLHARFAAIETPTWALLLASSVRAVGYNPDILDANAERLTPSMVVDRVTQCRPRLICIVIYGQNPNAGSSGMHGAIQISTAIKRSGTQTPICAVGSHISALPHQTLKKENSFDFVLCNEGVYSLRNLLAHDLSNATILRSIKGICYRDGNTIRQTKPEIVVPQSRMDVDLPGYAWDLLPYTNTPLDLYRTTPWHARYDALAASPYAAIYSSLGCMFKCDFCMINILNRNDNNEVGVASDYASMRFWSPDFVLNEIEKLVALGVKNIRISDEMFLLNKKYYVPLCEGLVERQLGKKINMWTYSRVDTIGSGETLPLIRNAGIKWLALGIESGNSEVRKASTKGRFSTTNIGEVINRIHQCDIDVIANYIFGLPTDSQKSMRETLDLSLALCTSAWNAYPAMALPGSDLYKKCHRKWLATSR